MKQLRQALLGILVALISAAVVLGGVIRAVYEDPNTVASLFDSATGLQPTQGTGTNSALGTSPAQTVGIGDATITPLRPSPTASCPVPHGWTVISVLAGDTLASIADAHGIETELLADQNCLGQSLSFNSVLPQGSFLNVPILTMTPTITSSQIACVPPPGWIVYTVKPGDTLFSLAQSYGTTVLNLQSANCLNSSLINAGKPIYVPNVPAPTQTPIKIPQATNTSPPAASATPPPPTVTPTATEPAPTDTPAVTATRTPPTFTPTATATASITPVPPSPTTMIPTTVPPSMGTAPASRPTATDSPVTPAASSRY